METQQAKVSVSRSSGIAPVNGRLLAARPIESDHILFCSFFFFVFFFLPPPLLFAFLFFLGGGRGGLSFVITFVKSVCCYLYILFEYLLFLGGSLFTVCGRESLSFFAVVFFLNLFFILLFLSLSNIALLIAHSLFSNFYRP